MELGGIDDHIGWFAGHLVDLRPLLRQWIFRADNPIPIIKTNGELPVAF